MAIAPLSGVRYTENMAANIICKSCGNVIEISEALTESIVATEKSKYQKIELDLRKKANELEEKNRTMELSMQRQLDIERNNIRLQTAEEIAETQRLKDREKDKMIDDLKKSLEDAQRKATQGSQQLQGEILELDLESTLKSLFPMDTITPVAKGVLGADISHTIKSPLGSDCGVMLWEIKRTKSWSDSWIGKLKEDLRSAKANIPAIISEVVPESAKSGIGFIEGIWVATAKMAPALALLLRKSLLDTARERASLANQKEKSALLYAYVTSHEFSQNVEMMLETYSEMQEQITKERMAMERSWKLRESQVQKLMSGVSGVYGSLQGIAGPALQNIKQLELN